MAAATVMIGSLGVPLSTQRAARRGTPFPCQDCACGCSDAETCWRDCCCYSNAQKVVWAEKNGVKVPIFVVAAVRREVVRIATKPACCENGASCCESERDDGKTVLLISALKCRGISVSIGFLPPALPHIPVALGPSATPADEFPAGQAVLYQSPTLDVATPPPNAA
jgi:hypothetical protein